MNTHRIDNFFRQVIMPAMLAGLLLGLPMSALAITAIPNISLSANSIISDAVENVKFTGQISVDGKIIDDLVFNNPQIIELVIDFRDVKGHGDKTNKQFITDAQAILHRPLRTTDVIDVTFPYYLASDPSVSRTAVASFELSYAGGNKVTMKLKLKAKPSSF